MFTMMFGQIDQYAQAIAADQALMIRFSVHRIKFALVTKCAKQTATAKSSPTHRRLTDARLLLVEWTNFSNTGEISLTSGSNQPY